MKKVRLQLKVPEDNLAEIDRLTKVFGLKGRPELFNYTLSLLAWVAKEREGGRIIVSMDEESHKYKELVIRVWRQVST